MEFDHKDMAVIASENEFEFIMPKAENLVLNANQLFLWACVIKCHKDDIFYNSMVEWGIEQLQAMKEQSDG